MRKAMTMEERRDISILRVDWILVCTWRSTSMILSVRRKDTVCWFRLFGIAALRMRVQQDSRGAGRALWIASVHSDKEKRCTMMLGAMMAVCHLARLPAVGSRCLKLKLALLWVVA
jgi:hypothetical protein